MVSAEMMMSSGMQCGCTAFAFSRLTRDVLAARLWQGDFAGCSGASFGVLEPDGTLLEISVYAQDPLALLEFLLDG